MLIELVIMGHAETENNEDPIGFEEQDEPPLTDDEVILNLHNLTHTLISQVAGKRKREEYLKIVEELKTLNDEIAPTVCRVAYILIDGVAEEGKKIEYLKIVDTVVTRINE